MEVLQLVSPTGSASASQRGMRGHIISIRHNSADSVANVLPRVDTSSIEIIFIGSRRSWNRRFQKEAKSLAEMRVRVDVIYKWLYALKYLNPLYSHVTIDDSASTKKVLEGIPDQLLAKATITNDPATEELLRRSTSDVAQLVSSSEDEERVMTRSLPRRGPKPGRSHEGQTGGGRDERRVPSDTAEGDISDVTGESSVSDLDEEKADIDCLNDAEGHHAREMVSTLMPILITDSASDLNGQCVDPSVALIAAVDKAFGNSDVRDRDSEPVDDPESAESGPVPGE